MSSTLANVVFHTDTKELDTAKTKVRDLANEGTNLGASTSVIKDKFHELSNEIPGVNAGLTEMERLFSTISSNKGIGGLVGKVTPLIGVVAIITELVVAISGVSAIITGFRFGSKVDDIADLGNKFGFTANEALHLQAQLGQANSSIGQYMSTVDKVTQAMLKSGDASRGYGAAFKSLDIRVLNSSGKIRGTSAVMNELQERFKTGSYNSALFYKILGEFPNQVIADHELYNKALVAVKESLQSGTAITRESILAANNQEEAIVRLKLLFFEFGSQLSTEFSPLLTELITLFTRSAREGGAVHAMLQTIMIMGKAVSAVIVGLVVVFNSFSYAVQGAVSVIYAFFKTMAIGVSSAGIEFKNFIGTIAQAFTKIASGDFAGAWEVVANGFTASKQRIMSGMKEIGTLWIEQGNAINKTGAELYKDTAKIVDAADIFSRKKKSPQEKPQPLDFNRTTDPFTKPKHTAEKEDSVLKSNQRAYEDYLRTLEKEQDALRKSTAAVELKGKASEKLNEIEKLQTGISDLLVKLSNEGANSQQLQVQATLAYVDALNKIKAAQDQRDIEYENAQLRKFTQTQLQSLDALRQQNDVFGLSTEAARRLNEALIIQRDTKTAINELDTTSASYQQAKNNLLEREIELSRQLTSIQEIRYKKEHDGLGGMIKATKDYHDTAGFTFSNVEQLTTKAFNSAADALTEFVTTGKLDFASLITSILTDIVRLMAQETMKSFIGMMGGGSSSGGGWGSLITSIGGALFGGGGAPVVEGSFTKFASGGIVNGPTRAIVGEGGESEAIIPASLLRHLAPASSVSSGGIITHINVSVNGGNTNSETATATALEVKKQVEAIFDQKMVRESKPGGRLNKINTYGARR